MEKVLKSLEQKQLPTILAIKQLCYEIINVLCQQPNILRIDAPVYVIGDLYGQFFDVLNIIEEHKNIKNYLFLGNYINRGEYSIQTILYLFCQKIKYRKSYSLLRGNHQSSLISEHYGFYDQIYRKYGNNEVWKTIVQVFPYLPLGAIINQKYFGVHSGIAQNLMKVDSIRSRNRIKQNPQTGVFYQLLWNDPDQNTTMWIKNQRSYGKFYGLIQIQQFCHLNKLKGVIRSNNILPNGFQTLWKGLCTTICSCPNFLHKYGNCGTINLISQGQQYQIEQFDRVQQQFKFEPAK